MRIGEIYVNGWASEKNPQRVGLFIGRSGKFNEFMDGRGRRFKMDVGERGGMRPAGEMWGRGELARELESAAEEHHPAASKYASEVLWLPSGVSRPARLTAPKNGRYGRQERSRWRFGELGTMPTDEWKTSVHRP